MNNIKFSLVPLYECIYNCNLQDHGQKKGDDILASVRLIGRYAFMVSRPRNSIENVSIWFYTESRLVDELLAFFNSIPLDITEFLVVQLLLRICCYNMVLMI